MHFLRLLHAVAQLPKKTPELLPRNFYTVTTALLIKSPQAASTAVRISR